jgi:sodium-dependent dicarboxylate transporter 2/3/5
VVVAAILCPIAAAMLKFVNGGEEPDVRQSAPILLAIGWGSGIGGFGSPIGGAANLVAIAYLEQLTGHEFMYVDWVLRFVPILFLVFLLNLFFLWQINRTTQDLNGSASYFKKLNEEFGPLKRGEKIGLTLFVLATMLAFLRPLYAEVLPGLKPAYSFLTLGLLMFVLRDENDEVMMDWKYAESHVMWGMMFLFASGMALGRMLIETGAVKQLTALIASSGPSGGLGTVALFAAFGCFLTELSSNTAAASIALPVVISITQAIGLNPVPYMLLTVVAVNCAYVLPVSTRAIPVSYGLDAGLQIRKGLRLTILNVLLVTALGWFCINYVPFFSRF